MFRSLLAFNRHRISLSYGLIVFLFFYALPFLANGQVNHLQTIEDIVAVIKQETGVEVIIDDIKKSPWPRTIFKKADAEDKIKLQKYLVILKEELLRYPRSFYDRSSFKEIYLVKNLFYKKQPTEGFYNFRGNSIYLDFARSAGHTIKQRHNIHHEIFHMIEFKLERKGPGWADPAWVKFNQESFRYGSDNAQRLANQQRNFFSSPHPGFMTAYGMSSTQEDKAEIFACLMVESQNNILHRWMQDNEVLRKKVQYLKNQVFEYSPEMNSDYWSRLFGEPRREYLP